MQDCTEKKRLRHDYEIAVSDHTRAFDISEAFVGTAKKDDYERLYNYVEQARVRAEDARLALERHIAEHGC